MEPQDRIERAATLYLENMLVLKLTPQARKAAFEFFGHRAAPRQSERRTGRGESLDVNLAEQNAVRLLGVAERIARSRGLAEVDIETMQVAIAGICPLYPFC